MLVLVAVPVESTLNSIWVVLGIAGVSVAWAAAYFRAASRRPKRLQVLCVVLVVAALFPYISSTDDSLRMQYLRAQQTTSTDDRSHDNLMRLYDAMDAPVAGQFYRFVVTFYTLALVVLPAMAILDRAIPRQAGRSPPLKRLTLNTVF